MPIEICFSSDDAYAQHLTVALTSILHNKNALDEISVSILDGGIRQANKQILQNVAQQGGAGIRFLPVSDAAFADAPIQTQADKQTHISKAAYYRLLLADFLPDVDKVIYLDCDIVCRVSLAELYALDMGNDWIQGVIDIDEERHAPRLGLKRYVCSGVLLFNLRAWRERDVQRLCLDFLRDHADLIVLHDQDVLNVVCQDHLSYIDRTWDAQACETRQGRRSGFNDVAKTAAIVHFIGERKPWNPGCRHPYKKEYFRYLAMTPYRDFVREHRRNCLRYALWHTKQSHGRKRWYLLGIRVWQKKL